jgi:hypothetical protein
MPIESDDITFRPHRLGFFFSLAVLLGMGLACLALSFQLHWAWLAGAALVALQGGALAMRYSIGSLAIRGYDLVVYQGVFGSRERMAPIWAARLEIRQSPFGRLIDTGTVLVTIDERPLRLRVAQLRAFRRLLTERKLQLLSLVERHALSGQRARVVAGELEDGPFDIFRSAL